MSLRAHSWGCSIHQSRRPQVLDKARQAPSGRRTAQRTVGHSMLQHRHLQTSNLAALGSVQALGSTAVPWRTLRPSMRQHRLVQMVERNLLVHGETWQPCSRDPTLRTALQQAALLGWEALQTDREHKQQHQALL